MVARHFVSLLLLAAASAVIVPLTAGYGSGSDGDTRAEKPGAQPIAATDQAVATACPGGLQRQGGRCAPHGQLRKFYRRGDRIVEDYLWIRSPGDWAPDPYGSYVQAGGYVYQVNRETQNVLRLVGAMDKLSN